MNKDSIESTSYKSFSPLLALKPYVIRYKGMLIATTVSLVLASLTTLAIPVAVRGLIDIGFSPENSKLIDQYFLVMILIAFLLAITSAARFYFVNWLGERIVADLRSDVFKNLTHLNLGFYTETHSGELMSRLSADTTQIKATVSAVVSQALRNILLLFGAVIMMVMTSLYLSTLVILAIPIIIAPLLIYAKTVRRLSREAQDTLATASAFASERLGAIQTLQAFNQEKPAITRFSQAVEGAFIAAGARMKARACLTAIAIFIVFASIVSILWLGSQEVLSGSMSVGTLSQFVLYSVFAAAALGTLSEIWGELQQAIGAAERLSELLHIKSGIQEAAKPIEFEKRVSGKIEFETVSFTYPSREDVDVLRDVDIAIEPGENVAIVGPSGAGKSTLFNLLLRFYDPDSGRILVDGLEINKLTLNSLRENIALVSQETALFAETIFDNIRFGAPEASIEEVKKASEVACADEFINALPNGYHTKLGERGISLSGGQRQRISIARAVLKDSPVLLLDEATSALDSESERFVQTALGRVMENRTTLIIAHRLSTVQGADRILVLDEGKVVEMGDHRQLVAKGGVYAKLAKMQFAAE